MSGLIFLAVVLAYWVMGARYVMPFAKDYVRAQTKRYPILYADESAYYSDDTRRYREQLNGEAVWVGVGKALFWPYVLMARWVTSRLVNSLTAEDRKAEELKDARRVIAQYEAEQLAKKGGATWTW